MQQHIHAGIVIDKLTPQIIDPICKRRETMGLASDEMRRTAGEYVDEDS